MIEHVHGCRVFMNLDLEGMWLSDVGAVMQALSEAMPADAHFHQETGLAVIYVGGAG